MEITKLFIYPIKSLGGISLQASDVEIRGLKYDRRWMLVDENYHFLTQRKLPALSRFSLTMTTDYLYVTNTVNHDSIAIPIILENIEMKRVVVWDDELNACILNALINEWFSEQLGKQVYLVYQSEDSIRPVDSKYALKGTEHTSLSDGYPILIIGEASMEYLNSICPEYIPLERFRPNIVLKDIAAFEEDELRNISINDAELFGVKPCARCVITTLNSNTLEFSKEPLFTLSKFRKFGNKILFGQNLVVHKNGHIKVGDTVY